jgi:hypothetical protein
MRNQIINTYRYVIKHDLNYSKNGQDGVARDLKPIMAPTMQDISLNYHHE